MSEMKIVTYNLRNQWHRDEQNGFIHRVGLMYHVIEREQPDVMQICRAKLYILQSRNLLASSAVWTFFG